MRKTVLIFILIYAVSFSLLFYGHSIKVKKDPGLNGEELAAAYRNVYLLPSHVQSDCYATNFSSTIYYWLGTYLIPITVNSQRIFKIIAMAFLPVLMFLIMHEIRPRTSWESAIMAPLLFMAAPAISWLSMMAIETPTDVVFSFLALLLAIRFSWKRNGISILMNLTLIGILIGWFVNFYGGSLVIALFIPLIIGWKVIAEKEYDRWGYWLFFCAAAYLLIWWPKLYSGPGVVMFGGGRVLDLTWNSIWNNLYVLYEDLFIKPKSYLVGGEVFYAVFPWLWYKILFLALVSSGVFALFYEKNKYTFWLLMIAAFNLFLGSLSSTFPGIRRVIPMIAITFIYGGFGIDLLVRMPWGDYFKKGLIIFLAANALYIFSENYKFVSVSYKPWLQRTFTYLPNKNYAETIEALISSARTEPLRLRGQIEIPFPKKPGLDEFIREYSFSEIYNEGKYAYDWRNYIILRGEMTEIERARLYNVYADGPSRQIIDRLYSDSQGYIFQHRDNVLMIKLFCQRRNLSDRNIVWAE